jgi:hypothetical protein
MLIFRFFLNLRKFKWENTRLSWPSSLKRMGKPDGNWWCYMRRGNHPEVGVDFGMFHNHCPGAPHCLIHCRWLKTKHSFLNDKWLKVVSEVASSSAFALILYRAFSSIFCISPRFIATLGANWVFIGLAAPTLASQRGVHHKLLICFSLGWPGVLLALA